eukprot:7510329-Lingulodinium_polyedra.AAC.1
MFATFYGVGRASRFDGSSQGGHRVMQQVWVMKRVGRSSLFVECQSMVEAPDTMNFIRFVWEIQLRRRT